jgi:tetratricopeptide (TPR) repeat protein
MPDINREKLRAIGAWASVSADAVAIGLCEGCRSRYTPRTWDSHLAHFAKEGKTMSNSTRKRPRLSVAMIVRNEQDVICSTLESITSIAEEIVVLDTGSLDDTPSIARRWGAKVLHSAWNDSFAEARNICMQCTTGDWVLWLDAGEQLSPQSAGKVRDFVDQTADARNAYLMMVEVPPADPLSSPEQIAQIRLIPRAANLTFEGRVRENLLASIVAAGMEIETAPGRILRHSREQNSARRIARAKRNLELIALERRQHPHEEIRFLLAEGDAYSELNQNEQARDAYTRAIEISPPGSTGMLEAYYGLLSCYHDNPALADCQLETGLKALETFPFDVQLLLAMGSYLQSKDRLDLASRSFEIAVKFGQVELSVWHLREVVEVATSCWCMILQLQGRAREACDALEESLAHHPQSGRLLRHGVELYIKMDEPEKAIRLMERLASPFDNLATLADAVRGACRAAKCDWLAALGYLQGAYLAGCQNAFCLRWLTVTLLGGGAISEARAVLEQWRLLEPDHPEMLTYLDAIAGMNKPAESDKPPSTAPQGDKPHPYRFDSGGTAPRGLPNLPQFSGFDAMLPADNA